MEKQAPANAMSAVFTDRFGRRERWTDDNGFLHIALRFMRTGLLKYAPTPETFPDGVPPGAVGPDGMVAVLVEAVDLAEPDSLASLAGLDCLREHEWASPDRPRDSVGSVAGVPAFDGEYVVGDAVIKDADAIRLLNLPDGDPERLVEASAAYSHIVLWEPEPYAGKAYAGKQKRIRYNHFTLLPEGEGRAGSEVRVLNAKEKSAMSEPNKPGPIGIWSRKLKHFVFARNEDDARKIAEEDAKDAAPAENEENGENAGLPDVEDIALMKAKLAAMAREIVRLTAQRDELLAAANGDALAAVADEIVAEREEAAEVMAANGMDKANALNLFKEKKLRGSALKVFAMNALREKAGRALIPAEQAASGEAVNGMWAVVRDFAGRRTAVVGAVPPPRAMNMTDPEIRRRKALAAIGYTQKGSE